MITIFDEFRNVNKQDLFNEVNTVLSKRAELWERYSRGITFSTSGNTSADTLQILFEKFIVDLSSGYLSGDVTYSVDVSSDVEKEIGTKLFGKQDVTKQYAEELQYILNTLAATNNDDIEKIQLFKQVVLFGSTYERVLEDENNKLSYYNLDALNTVAVWNNSMNPEVVAVISKFEVKLGASVVQYYRVYTAEKIEIYEMTTGKEIRITNLEDKAREHVWKKVPVNVYESEFSILDRCGALIRAYENLLNNVRNTYQYNDEDCKMKISGYRAKNPVTITDPTDPTKQILNPARQLEDNYVLASKTFYVEDGGDADWLTKPVSAGDVTTMLKYYVDSIFQMCGIPNTADLAFNSGDLNASAIDRKFYVMNIMMSEIKNGVIQLLYDRFEMLLERVNIKLNKNYSMENVVIEVGTNLPSMQDEAIDQLLKLNGIVSEKTILTKLGFDYETETVNKEDEMNGTLEQTRPEVEQINEYVPIESDGHSESDNAEGENDEDENE